MPQPKDDPSVIDRLAEFETVFLGGGYFWFRERCKKLTEQVARALWIGGDLPQEYLEYRLCRDVFHCLPSELAAEPWESTRKVLACIQAESRTINRRRHK